MVERVEDVDERVQRTHRRNVGVTEAVQVKAHGITYRRQPSPLCVPHPSVGDNGVEQDHRSGARRPAAVEGDTSRCQDEATAVPVVEGDPG